MRPHGSDDLRRAIESPRLVLRAAQPADAGWVTQAVNDPRIYTMVSRIAPGQTEAVSEAFLEDQDAAWRLGTARVFSILAGGHPVGMVGVHRPDLQMPFEIGYWLRPAAWGQGYATEAAATLIDWMQRTEGVRAMVSGHFADNPASGRVLRKLGFLPAGRHPVWCAGRGRPVDHVNMAWIAEKA